jgi:hypothetical protein
MQLCYATVTFIFLLFLCFLASLLKHTAQLNLLPLATGRHRQRWHLPSRAAFKRRSFIESCVSISVTPGASVTSA